MNASNIKDPVSREKLKEILKKYRMTLDAYMDEKIEEDYSILFPRKK